MFLLRRNLSSVWKYGSIWSVVHGKSKAFFAFTEAQSSVISLLSCCDRNHDRNRGFGVFQRKEKEGIDVHSCSSRLEGGGNEDFSPLLCLCKVSFLQDLPSEWSQ